MMTYQQIKQLNNKLYFTVSDIACVLGIKNASARVVCSRYVRKAEFIRLKNNFYITAQKWDTLGTEDFLKIANFLQVPSYVSFISALQLYEVTTQVSRNFLESVALKRSLRIEARGAQFNYYKLKKKLYFGFTKKLGVFVAAPEKALLDALYFSSLGKYSIDSSALDIGKLDTKQFIKMSKAFPPKTRELARRLCKI